jgi:hypothetical protein
VTARIGEIKDDSDIDEDDVECVLQETQDLPVVTPGHEGDGEDYLSMGAMPVGTPHPSKSNRTSPRKGRKPPGTTLSFPAHSARQTGKPATAPGTTRDVLVESIGDQRLNTASRVPGITAVKKGGKSTVQGGGRRVSSII